MSFKCTPRFDLCLALLRRRQNEPANESEPQTADRTAERGPVADGGYGASRDHNVGNYLACAGGDPRTLVNGQLQPTIMMKPGEIQRWRFVNATMQQVSYLTYRARDKADKRSRYLPYSPGDRAGSSPVVSDAPC